MSAKPRLTWRYCCPGRYSGRNGSAAIRSLYVGAIKLCRRYGKTLVSAYQTDWDCLSTPNRVV